MKHNVNFNGIRNAIKHAPETLHTEGLMGAMAETAVIFSKEYKQEMKEKHPDWYKKEET